MAQIVLGSIPREFEVTRKFESQGDENELRVLHDKLFSADMDADVRMVLGKSMEQLSALRQVSFLRVFWARFGEFVQSVVFAQAAGGGPTTSNPSGAITKSELTKRYSTSNEG